jgi:hypothetical protein
MGWRSIHWHRSALRQKTRFERYADDSWMFLWSPFGRVYIAFKGQKPRPARPAEPVLNAIAGMQKRLSLPDTNMPQFPPKEKP